MGNVIDLSKKAKVSLAKKQIVALEAEVVGVLDSSGSMDDQFDDGTAQEITDRLAGVGLAIDTNKSIDIFTFNTEGKFIGSVTEANSKGFVKDVLLKRTYASGGTNYSPVMQMVLDKYFNKAKFVAPAPVEEKQGFFGKLFGKKKEAVVASTPVVEQPNKKLPVFAMIVTDGDNFDKDATRRLIAASSSLPIFWQFVGIGHADFKFLKELDKIGGRDIDNVGFFEVKNINTISDEKLYDQLFDELPKWLEAAKAKGIL